jgi:pimeloyl-ACP methyl ester carboxylesterase
LGGVTPPNLAGSNPQLTHHVRVYGPYNQGVGHLPFLEDPERFNRELAELTRRTHA